MTNSCSSVANGQIPGVTGLLSDVVFGDTLELALKLHPSVRKVLVAGQAPKVDGYEARVRGALERFSRRVELTYVPQQSLAGLLAAVRAAPSDSLILFTRYVPDDVSSNVYTDEVLRRMAEVSPVPIYGTTDAVMGTGVVGGMMRASRATGLRLGAITRQIIGGVPPERFPSTTCGRYRRSIGVSCGAGTSTWPRCPRDRTFASSPRRSGTCITGTSSSARWRWSWCRPCSSRDSSGSERGCASRSRRYAPGRRRFERATSGFSKWPDGSSTRRRRRGQGSPRTCTTTCASSSSSCRWGSARSRARRDSSRTGRRRRPWRRSRPTPRRCSRGFDGCRRICIPRRCDSSGWRPPCERTVPRWRSTTAWTSRSRAKPSRPTSTRTSVCFRIAQEALRNGIVHGGARRLSVSLAGSDDLLDLVVTDDGVGFDVASVQRAGGGLGLVTMNERARVVGATVDIASQPARGTTVRVRGPAVLPGQDALTDASAQADAAEAAPITQKLKVN